MLCTAKALKWLAAAFVLFFGAPLAAQQVRLPSTEQLRAYGLELGWCTQVSMNPLRDSVRDIAFDGQVLYVQTNRGVIHAIRTDAAEPPAAAQGSAAHGGGGGQTLWMTQVGQPDLPSFRPAANSRELFVVNGSQLFVLDKHTGNMLWQAQLPGAPSSPLAANDDFAYVGFIDGQLRAYDLHGPREAWFYRTGDTISVPALPMRDLVAYASHDGILYVSFANRRELVFQFETDYPVSAALAERNEWIFMASEDFDVYCIQSRTGVTRWRRSLGEPITRPLVVIDDELYVNPDGGGLHRLDTATGQRRWRFRDATQFVSASPTRIYASDALGRLIILDRATGEQVGLLDLQEYPTMFVNELNDRLFLCSRDGLLISLHETALEQPAPHSAPSTPAAEPAAEAPAAPPPLPSKPEAQAAPAGAKSAAKHPAAKPHPAKASKASGRPRVGQSSKKSSRVRPRPGKTSKSTGKKRR